MEKEIAFLKIPYMKRFSVSLILPRVFLIAMLAALLILPVLSCRKTGYSNYPVSYNVTNDAGFRIKVIFNGLAEAWSSYHGYSDVDDSIVYLQPGEVKTLFIAEWAWLQDTPEKDTVIRGMRTLRVYRNETEQSKTDFMKTRLWAYFHLNRNRAELDLSVASSDFNP